MPFRIGPMELIIILVIVMIIFGVGKLSGIGAALGQSIKEFRKASTDETTEDGSNSTSDQTTAKS